MPTSVPQSFPSLIQIPKKEKKEKKKNLENTQAGWGAETYVKLNSKEKQLDQTNLKHDQNKNSICGLF